MPTVEENLNLVGHAIKKYFSGGKDYGHIGFSQEDLFQIGSIGLIKAAKGYDDSLGFKFSTYAIRHITGEIYSELNRKSALIKYPRNIKMISLKLINRGVNYTIKSIMDEFELSKYSATLVLDCISNYQLPSLDEELPHTGGAVLFETIKCEDYLDPESELRERLSVLDELEFKIITMSLEGKSQKEISEVVGIAQPSVSRRIKKSIAKINMHFPESFVGGV